MRTFKDVLIPKKVLFAGFLGVVGGSVLGWLLGGLGAAMALAALIGLSAVRLTKDE